MLLQNSPKMSDFWHPRSETDTCVNFWLSPSAIYTINPSDQEV